MGDESPEAMREARIRALVEHQRAAGLALTPNPTESFRREIDGICHALEASLREHPERIDALEKRNRDMEEVKRRHTLDAPERERWEQGVPEHLKPIFDARHAIRDSAHWKEGVLEIRICTTAAAPRLMAFHHGQSSEHSPLDSKERQILDTVLARISAKRPMRFVPTDDPAQADITYFSASVAPLPDQPGVEGRQRTAYTTRNSGGKEIILHKGQDANNLSYLLLHETGHALGLKHPHFDESKANEISSGLSPDWNTHLSTMSYNGCPDHYHSGFPGIYDEQCYDYLAVKPGDPLPAPPRLNTSPTDEVAQSSTLSGNR